MGHLLLTTLSGKGWQVGTASQGVFTNADIMGMSQKKGEAFPEHHICLDLLLRP
jgi:hypothetical protein